jgi:multimeric flavodoxin WrbA
MEQIISSDVILFSSPVYFWGFSAQIKALIDRCYSLATNYKSPKHRSLLAGKRIGLLVTGGSSYEQNAEGMFAAFDRVAGFLLATKTGDLFIGECIVPAELSVDVKEKAMALARSLVS